MQADAEVSRAQQERVVGRLQPGRAEGHTLQVQSPHAFHVRGPLRPFPCHHKKQPGQRARPFHSLHACMQAQVLEQADTLHACLCFGNWPLD